MRSANITLQSDVDSLKDLANELAVGLRGHIRSMVI